MIGLTSRQALVLDVIRASLAERGLPPTLKEIAAAIGGVSTNGASDHVRALERKGYLRRLPWALSRGLVLTEAAGSPTACVCSGPAAWRFSA